MRCYHIYSISEDIANFFYGRERLFYNLFHEHQYAPSDLKQIIEQQIQYITLPFPLLHLHRMISQRLSKRSDYVSEGNVYWIGREDESNRAKLEINKRKLLLYAWGSYDAESIFFEALRQMDGRLLAIDLQNERYGWLKPLKERNYIIT
jgi:Sporulation inhibitor of replication protein SirA